MTGASRPGDLHLRPPAESLDPRVRRLWRIRIAIGAVVAVALAAVAAAAWVAAADPAPVWPVLVIASPAVAGALAAALAPPVAYRAIRFEVTPLGLAVRTGLIVHTLTIVPHARIQSVRTTTDPLQRALGLATVEVRTAGTAVARVPGLDAARVATLQADLAAHAGTGAAT